MPNGYSGKSLADKLGFKPAMKIMLLNQPENYFELIGLNIQKQLCSKGERPDLVHLFASGYQEMVKSMEKIRKLVHPKIVIWVSWKKKSSGEASDLTEELV